MASAERVGERLREWRGKRRLTQQELGEKVGSDNSRIGRIEKGAENLTLESIDKLAEALAIDPQEFFRPDQESGRDEQRAQGSEFLEALVQRLDAEAPAEDTWRGDVLKAIAALNRALRRGEDSSATGDATASSRR